MYGENGECLLLCSGRKKLSVIPSNCYLIQDRCYITEMDEEKDFSEEQKSL